MSATSAGERRVAIRHATPADAPTVRTFVAATLWAFRLDDDHADLAAFGRPFSGALAELVAVDDDDAPIGVATLWPRTTGPRDVRAKAGWIGKLFVDPDHRGRGVAHALLDAIVDEAHGWRLEWIGLSTLPILRDAVRLYESYGFVRERRARELRFWLQLSTRE